MPIIGKVFRVFYTMIHELGHALMAMITSGEIISISLFADTSGNTITKSKGKFEQFLIAIAGYPIAAVLVFVFFYLIHIEKTNMVLFIFAGIALVELVFWKVVNFSSLLSDLTSQGRSGLETLVENFINYFRQSNINLLFWEAIYLIVPSIIGLIVVSLIPTKVKNIPLHESK